MDLSSLIAQMQATDSALTGAATFIGGVPALIQAAVSQALANGATQAQLQPVIALGTQLQTDSTALLNAIAANTPQPSPTPDQLNKASGK